MTKEWRREWKIAYMKCENDRKEREEEERSAKEKKDKQRLYV